MPMMMHNLLYHVRKFQNRKSGFVMYSRHALSSQKSLHTMHAVLKASQEVFAAMTASCHQIPF